MNSGVYLILNTENNHKYVGSSINLSERERIHIRQLNKQAHSNAYLQNSWNKYGKNSFAFHTLALCAREKRSLLALEQLYIDILQPEYNISPTAGSPLGYTHTKEARAKMSVANKGRRHTEESKAKISTSHIGNKYALGHKHTDEHKAKNSAAHMGNKNFLGHKHTDETKAEMSATRKGRKHTAGAKAKMSAALMGNKNTLGKPWSAARRAAYNKQKEQDDDLENG